MKDKFKIISGLGLCVIGIVLILYFYSFTKILVIIPITLFLLSIFTRNRTLSITLNSLTILPFLIFYIGSRIPVSKDIEIESRIRYQMVDIGQGDFLRNGIEYKSDTKRVFLADTASNIHWLYVSNSDFKKLWPESPQKMKENNYTIKAKFRTRKLLLGDYAVATVIKIDSITEPPLITK